jgi:hypothetical protein
MVRLRTSWALLTVPLLAGCAAQRTSSVAYSREEWSEDGFRGRRLVSEHFEIVSTIADAEFEAALPAFLEAAYANYRMTMPGDEAGRPKLRTYILATREQWESFTGRHFPARASLYRGINFGGFTEGGTSVSYYTTRSAALATLAHEGWHQYTATRFDVAIPAWLNEGLACNHEAVEPVAAGPVFTPRRNAFRLAALREAVHSGRLLPLGELLDTDAGIVLRRGDSRTTQAYYAQVWALVLFLRHGAGGRYAEDFDHLLADISSGAFRIQQSAAGITAPDARPGRATFQRYFRVDPADIEGPLSDFVFDLTGFSPQ